MRKCYIIIKIIQTKKSYNKNFGFDSYYSNISYKSKFGSYFSKDYKLLTTPFTQVTSFVSKGLNSVIEATIGSKANREMVEKLSKENQELQKS